MNPELLAKIAADIERLQADVKALSQNNTIPRDIETAFTERLRVSSKLEATGTGSAGSTTLYPALPVTVPANPSGTLAVTYNGTTYNLLYR